ncbi:MerR family transcriptional regulator [Chitinophaga sp. SYP-B3965]|uniref:MerR family transcriptional regulator n=1 Tax=Chitinophaga sp. SYP-B3965 TaxID=2663120 RepID=UPI0020A68CF3|nr:MerR family transcriptional regulator [Chitinophaga sp. SYP-B3965]
MMQQLDLFGAEPQQPAPGKPAPQKELDKDNIVGGEELPASETIGHLPLKGKKRGRKSLKELASDPHVIQELEKLTLDKQYYSISEVAGMFRVNTSLIRYWENEFDILQPKKNRKGDRLFRQEDIQNLKLIYHLLRERKYTIEGAKQKLREDKRSASRNFEMVKSLQKVRAFLTELKDQL